ncbi:MAG: serine protease [Clostridiales bacterium]|nr:serine protease [Clostridiales bacterium]
MSEKNIDKNKDYKKYEFIKEQVIPRKRKKYRKWLVPFLMTIFMAIVFGLVAALTFCISEPKLYELLHKDETNPFIFPTPTPEPDEHNDDYEIVGKSEDNQEYNQEDDLDQNSSGDERPVFVESIDASIEDYVAIYDDIKKLSNEMNKSILTISSIMDEKDWFGNPIEKRIYTTGILVENDGKKLMILVSLDRVRDASSIKVELSDTISIDAVLQDYESELNLAILTVSIVDVPAKILQGLTPAQMGESYIMGVGSPIMALGSPNGYPRSIDVGIITSDDKQMSITDSELDLFNTNMVFNNESDGIIINFKGEIIGLITRTLNKDSKTEQGTILGISKVKSYIHRMVNQTPRVYCGVIAENLTELAKIEHDVPRGVYVYDVMTDSPAYKGGLMSGDIILNVSSRVIANMNNFYSAISEYEPGDVVVLKVKRTSVSSSNKSNEIKLRITLDKKKQ